MESAKMIRELREGINMSRREFSLHTGISVRTLEDWEAGKVASVGEQENSFEMRQLSGNFG